MNEIISFYNTETGEQLNASVLAQTVIGGTNYLLAVDSEDKDSGIAYILKEVRSENEDTIYEIVSDETELMAISKVFSELLDDVDFEL